MIIWLTLWASVILLLALYSHPNINSKGKNTIANIVAIILTYFSGFRDGLGQDYLNYKDIIQQNDRVYSYTEPLFTLMVKLVADSLFTEVFFFLFFAFITNFIIIKVFNRYNNFQVMVFIYLSFTIFYFNTFNIVRQFASAAIILYAFKYIEERAFFKYIIIILIASSIHLSAFFCLPLYFLWNIRPNRIFITIITFTSFLSGIFFKGFVSHLIMQVSTFFDLYTLYLESENESTGGGLLTIFFNLILIIILFSYKDKEMKPIHNFILIGFTLLVTLYNLIPSFHYLYRISIYTLFFFPLIFVIPMKNIKVLKVIVITSGIFLFSIFLLENKNNDKIIPSSIIPIYKIVES